MEDLVNITKSTIVGSLLFIVALVFLYDMTGFPRSIFIIEAILNLIFCGGVRFVVRWVRETFSRKTSKQKTFVLVVGAGKAGSQLIREIEMNPGLGIRIVGFIDDDPLKKDNYIHGVKVVGTCREIPALVKKLAIDEVLICFPSAGYSKIKLIVKMVKDCGIDVKILPSISEIISKNGLWSQLKEVPYNALLGRPILNFRRKDDIMMLGQEIHGKTVLITGAAGSIGAELSRQSAKYNPELLILYDRDETSLYYLEIEFRKQFPACIILPVIGDVLNKEKVDHLLSHHGVDLIYHAAAYKHVPMMEREPFEAIHNNIFATKIIAEAALANRVAKCVYISTDKSVNPANIMGVSKRVGELVMQAYAGVDTKFISVRFGNVLGSKGSVIPLFKKQVADGGPITVTHPDVTRYFMSISEAVQLVMTAGAMGKGGEIFLLDMGQPIKISDMANKLIKFSGLIPGKDIEIDYIGLRPGEKMHEELYWKGENVVLTDNKKITMLEINGFDKELFFKQLKQVETSDNKIESQNLFSALRELVPEGDFSIGGQG